MSSKQILARKLASQRGADKATRNRLDKQRRWRQIISAPTTHWFDDQRIEAITRFTSDGSPVSVPRITILDGPKNVY